MRSQKLLKKDIENLFHPVTNLKTHHQDSPLILDKGEGIYVYDIDGKKYIEGLAGLWCNSLGYGNEELVKAASDQMQKFSYGTLFASKTHEPAIELAEKLIKLSPYNSGKVFFGNSGSDANDTQYKIFTYLNNAKGLKNKKNFLARKKAYHGITAISASMTGLPAQHKFFDLPFSGFHHTDTPHFYRESNENESEIEFTERLAKNLRNLITDVGSDSFAAMIAEPLIGAGGVIIPPENYFPRIQEVLDEFDIALIDDEVITGFGRTGKCFGLESFSMKPDSITIAKAMSSGYIPISAVIIPDEIFEPLKEPSNEVGIFGHGYTYSGHPVACAVSLKTLEIYEKEDTFNKVNQISPHFQKRLHDLMNYDFVGETRGIGLIGAIELVKNKETKESFDPYGATGKVFAKICQNNGLIIRAIGDVIAICPPLIINLDEIDKIFNILEHALEELKNKI
tara:strand:- start:1731 stop:3089 length:1359 start_codon:yes stop_codon:yes gene_type:complete